MTGTYREQRRETILWLRENGYPPLPVAPAQNPKLYHRVEKAEGNRGDRCPLTENFEPIPIYTGKNPSYLDKEGKPHLINHREFQKRLPTQGELKQWFSDPRNGVGTLGGWNNTAWIDFDIKQFDYDEEFGLSPKEVCNAVVEQWIEDKDLDTFREETHSGGWRVGVRVKQKPEFTNFALTPGGKHLGEALGEGRFTVLAPTVGPSGQPYRSHNRVLPVEVESLEAIGIFPVASPKKKTSSSSTNFPRQQTGYVPGSIPLEQLGNDRSREILNGNVTGDRSEALAFALQEWYGWHNWANENGISVTGTPEDLAHYAGEKLGIDGDRINRIIKTIDQIASDPAALHRGGEESCWKKIRRLDKATFEAKCPASIKANFPKVSTVSSGRGDRPDSQAEVISFPSGSVAFNPDKALENPREVEVIARIDELIEQGLTGSKLTYELSRLSAASGWYNKDVVKLYWERRGEAEIEDDRPDNQTEVNNLLNLGQQAIDLHDYLPDDLASPLASWASWLNIKHEVILLAVLAGASSLHKVGTELVIHKNQNFTVPPTIFAALISESGQRKSPVFNNLIRQPLNILRQEKVEAFNREQSDYETQLKAWEQSENKGEKPKPPQDPTLYYFTNATGEAIPVQAAKDPGKALLGLVDEIAGLFKSQNSYRSGHGSDKQDLLSYFDGSGQTVLRTSGIKVDVRNIYLSLFGTIQPAVLRDMMQDCSDPDGQWARFLFVIQPLIAATLSDDDGQAICIKERLAEFYRKIDRLPEMEYRLSREAFKRYQPLYNQLERLRVTHPKPGMRAIYSKMEGYVGRLALNLHVLWELALGHNVPDPEIPQWIMEMAIQLAKFFIGQVKLVHSDSDDEQLAPQIVKLIELSKRLENNGLSGWIKAKQFVETFSKKKRPTAQQARDWMTEAVNLGHGATKGKGNRLEFHWNGGLTDNPTPPHSGNRRVPEELVEGSLGDTQAIENKELCTQLGNMGSTPSLNEFIQEVEEIPPYIEDFPTPEFEQEQPSLEVEEITEEVHEPIQELLVEPPLSSDSETLEESSISAVEEHPSTPSPTIPQVTPGESQSLPEINPGTRVFVESCPHTDKFGPFSVEYVQGDRAKVEMFAKEIPLSDLRIAG